MKKIISLLLALLMLGSVTAFAITLEAPVEKPEELMELPMLALDEGVSTFTAGEGGTYYVMLDTAKNYEKVTAIGSGCVDAKVFEYNPEKHVALDGIYYCVKNGDTVVEGGLDYVTAKEKVKELNDAGKTTQHKIAVDGCYVNIIEIKVEDNYTGSYKEGKVKITAQLDKKAVGAEIEVISDVFVYDLENVKYASKNEVVLDEMFDGVSAYDEVTVGAPTVVTKQAFRHIKGQKLIVHNNGVEIAFDKIGEPQSALNFKAFVKVQPKTETKERELAFGFYGNKQISSSDFVITPEIDMTYYELREFFGVKLEEQDTVVYKIYKNGTLVDEFVVDYATIKPNKEVEIEIEGKAGEQLGSYYITAGYAEVEVEDEPEIEGIGGVEDEEEANPNTGAPTFLEWIFALIFS